MMIVVSVISAGCGARVEYQISEVTLERHGWDSLSVGMHFKAGTSLGRTHRIEPEATSILAFDAGYDTLFAGTGPSVLLPDTRLGSEAPIVIEACARLRDHWICDQVTTSASRKRISVTPSIDYPIDDAFIRGRYDLGITVERISPDGTRGAVIDYSGPLNLALDAVVSTSPESRLRIPLSRASGTFNLSRLPGYHDFRFFLDSELMDNGEAFVHFDVLAGFSEDNLEPVASESRHISPVSSGERLANVQGFARQAARTLAGELTGFMGARRIEINLESWTFDRSEDRYRIALDVIWRRGIFGGRTTRISGELTVGEQGERAVFALSDGNRDGVERWSDRFDGDIVALGDLDAVAPRQRYRPGGTARY